MRSLSPGWLRGLLLASLCLNVLLGAFMATRWVEGMRLPNLMAGPPQLIERVARRLPAADADILRRAFRSRERQLTDSQAEYERALVAAGRLLVQTPVDAGALRAAVAEARDKRIRIGDLAIDAFLEALPQMSPEGRRDLTRGIRAK
jgi:uncharacterized membrane protein